MPARLTVHPPFRAARNFLIRGDGDYVLGRDTDCDLVVGDDRVSRRHARLRSVDGEWLVEDLESKNGTAVDGAAVGAGAPLKDGSWLSFGGLLGTFGRVTAEEEMAAARRRLESWHSSLDMQRELSPDLGLERLLERILESVLGLSRTDRGFVMLEAPEGDFEVRAFRGLDAGDLGAPEFAGSTGALAKMLEERRLVAVSDVSESTLLGSRPSVVEQEIRALVCVPLVVAGSLIGAIYADSRTAGLTFEELDAEILEALAGHAALAISVARLDSEIRGLKSRLPTRLDLDPEATRRVGDELERVLDRSRAVSTAGDAGAQDARSGRSWRELRALHGPPGEISS